MVFFFQSQLLSKNHQCSFHSVIFNLQFIKILSCVLLILERGSLHTDFAWGWNLMVIHTWVVTHSLLSQQFLLKFHIHHRWPHVFLLPFLFFFWNIQSFWWRCELCLCLLLNISRLGIYGILLCSLNFLRISYIWWDIRVYRISFFVENCWFFLNHIIKWLIAQLIHIDLLILLARKVLRNCDRSSISPNSFSIL